MKKTATILLALVILFCLVHGTFAGDKKVDKKAPNKYMVLYLHVKSGEIAEVYEAQNLPTDLPLAPQVNDKGKPFNINGYLSDKAFATIFATSSPGCRYIKHPSCYYVKVCE